MTLGMPRCIRVRREIETTAGRYAVITGMCKAREPIDHTSSKNGVQEYGRPDAPDLDGTGVRQVLTLSSADIPRYHGRKSS